MLLEERNTEIERDNRLLYEKIMGHFKNLKESTVNIQNRNKWRKRKHKNRTITDSDAKSNTKSINSFSNTEGLRYLQRIKPLQQQTDSLRTLFCGSAAIDGHELNIKILMDRQKYYLMARNSEMELRMQMSTD